MASVLDDATTRLYAGALLGKSLTKSLGEAGATTDSQEAAKRRATLTAGVASGALDPKKLSSADASLLGTALSGDTKQKVSSSPLGFVGGFLGNLAKGAGEFGESLVHIPPALYNIAAEGAEKSHGNPLVAGIQSLKGENKAGQLPGQIASGVAHDFSSPRQIYEHPFNPIMDVAGAFTGGAGLAAKGAGFLARGGAFGEGVLNSAGKLDRFTGISKDGTQAPLAGFGGAARRAINLTSPEGRAGARLSPGNLPTGAEPAMKLRQYSPNLGWKYFVQKPTDALFDNPKIGNLKVPGRGEETLLDKRGRWLANKADNRTRAQVSAGTNEEFGKAPIHNFLAAYKGLFKNNQGKGVYQHDASFLRLVGVDNLDKLDAYAERLREGEDIHGQNLAEHEMQHSEELLKRIEDPKFRYILEHPTDEMRQYEYATRRLNVAHAEPLDIDPRVSEDAAFARIRELTGKTTEELRAELPEHLRDTGEFAKGLQALQESIIGTKHPDIMPGMPPDPGVLATQVPGVNPALLKQIIERAVESLKADAANGESEYARLRDPNYVQGRTIYQKVATQLHDYAGLSEEQAQSLSRGVSMEEGVPTYMPSANGEGMHFGLRQDPLKTRIGRNLGISRFKPLEGDIPRQGEYYEFKAHFRPRSASAASIGLQPARNYLKDANYDSFMKGVMQTSPEMIAKNAFQIQRDLIQGKLNPKMIDQMALKGEDGQILEVRGPGEMKELLGEEAPRYAFVPVDSFRKYLEVKAGMEMDWAKVLKDAQEGYSDEADLEAEIEGLADERAHEFIDGVAEKAGHGKYGGVILPITFVKQVVDHTRITEEAGSFAKFNEGLIGRWKSAVLSFMPAWLIRTSVGHFIVGVIDGTVNPKFWTMAHKVLENRPVQETTHLDPWRKAGDALLGGSRDTVGAINAPKAHFPYTVNQGGMIHELSDVGQGAREINQTIIPRTISGGVHTQTNWQRRGIYLRNLDRAAKQRLAELGKDFEHPGGFWDLRNIDAAMDPRFQEEVLKSPDLSEHMLDQLARISYTFGEMSPWERRLVKKAFPFYGWYKFISKFVWSMPLNYPGRTRAIAALGHIGTEETSKLGPIPDYLQGAIWFNHDDMTHAKYLNLYGINPLGNFGTPFGPRGMFGLVNPGELSPLIQSVLAAAGVSPLTGGAEPIDPASGIEAGRYGQYYDVGKGEPVAGLFSKNWAQRGVGQLLRSFPELRTAELFNTKGNPVYPESLPFIDEKPMGVSPTTRRGNTPLSWALGEIGAQPREYDLIKRLETVEKLRKEVEKKNLKARARNATRLAAP